ncbi:flavin reductase family protein [Bdellovibrio svalbardensis]|uniref:Flavin reductase family protein n=1 Tax=Bdellovibrio svalbardensis TaxID=2972972 RepID=A0ABT6DL80_9BACT|nr:flavin reductase family protein [Bdellovibrio svalbardensis]MDG0817573.1 flavin reductase family protein [Bdellovibrio svalbardensis]
MKKRNYPLKDVYRLLEPGPVALVTTSYRGESNIMTMSWQTMIDFEPPIVACVISNRNHSFEMIRKSKECVLNIPTLEIAKQVVGCGNTSGDSVDKFKKFKLTALPATTVKAPLIDECYASLECKVIDSKLANKYNLFFLEVQKAWVAPLKKYPSTLHHFGDGHFMIAGKTIKLASKMK